MKSQKQTSPFVVHKCPICGKNFIPAAMHIYRKNRNVFCGWNCYLKSDTVQGPKICRGKIVIITTIDGTVMGEVGIGVAADMIGCDRSTIYSACRTGKAIFKKYFVRYTDEME